MESLPRSKDGVPTFDGSAERLAMFKEEARAYLFTLEHHKRYLAGPRLGQGLTGVARTVIRKKLAHPRRAYDLIQHLEQTLGQPTLIQAAQHKLRLDEMMNLELEPVMGDHSMRMGENA